MNKILLLAVTSTLLFACQQVGRGLSAAPTGPAVDSGTPSTSAFPDSSLSATIATEGCGPSGSVSIKNTGGSPPQRGRPPFPPIRPGNGPEGSSLNEESTVDVVRSRGFPVIVPSTDVPLQVLVARAVEGGSKPTDVRLYYALFDISQSMQLPEFYQDGGFALEEQLPGVLNFDESVAEAGDFGTVVNVGAHKALIVLGDPFFEGSVRTWNMLWTDGVRDMDLAAPFENAEQAVDLARSIYCTN